MIFAGRDDGEEAIVPSAYLIGGAICLLLAAATVIAAYFVSRR